MKKLGTILTLGALLALAAPAVAGDDDSSWYAGLDVMMSRPSNLPNGFVLDDPNDNGEPEGDILSVDPAYDFSGRIYFGQAYGGDMGGWAVSITSLDASEDESASHSGNGQLWDILYNADDATEDFDGKAFAEVETEAMTVDVMYWRPMVQGERFMSQWNIGLRYATLDHDMDVRYRGPFVNEFVMLESEMTGYGLRVGMGAGVKLTESLWLGGGIGYSWIMGDTESSTLNRDGSDVEVNTSREVDSSYSIIEAGAGLKWYVSDNVSLKFAYEFSQWNDAVTVDSYPDDVTDSFVTSETHDVNWDSFVVGVGFKF